MTNSKKKSKHERDGDICGGVLRTIKKQDLKMKPKRYFVLGSILIGTGIGLTVLVGAFLVNVKLYQLSLMRPFDWLSFGVNGIWPFILLFPWKVLLLALGAVALGIYLVRMSTGTVHLRIITVASTIVVITVAGALLLAKFNFNRTMAHISPVSMLYDHHSGGKNWMTGCVESVSGNNLMVRDFEGNLNKVDASKYTNKDLAADMVGNQIEMLGSWLAPGSFSMFNMRPVNGENCPLED